MECHTLKPVYENHQLLPVDIHSAVDDHVGPISLSEPEFCERRHTSDPHGVFQHRLDVIERYPVSTGGRSYTEPLWQGGLLGGERGEEPFNFRSTIGR